MVPSEEPKPTADTKVTVTGREELNQIVHFGEWPFL
jgi:hypothetical protein